MDRPRAGVAMKADDRKAAIAAYKKRKSAVGVFAIRCTGSDQVWVGPTLNLDTVQNRIWFTLRAGSHSNAELQRAWSAHDGADFTFEPLEQLEDEELAYVRNKLLKERELHWRAALNSLSV
jgi:hypothetical protein